MAVAPGLHAIASNPAILRHPIRPADAWRQVNEWLACDVVWIPLPTTQHPTVFERLLDLPAVTSRLNPTLIWPRSPSNTASRCAQPTAISQSSLV